MANPEHAQIILQGVESWNHWRSTVSDDLLPLIDLDLSGMDLSNQYLRGADFSGVNLCGAKLDCSDLSDVDLSNSNLTGATLHRAELTRANLNGASLNGLSATEVNLAAATLVEASLKQANLQGANCNRAIFTDANITQGNFKQARLIQADLSFTTANEVTLDEAILNRAIFIESNLKNASFKRAIMFEVRLNKSYLNKSDFSYVELKDSTLTSATIDGANFKYSVLDRVDLTLASLVAAQFNQSTILNSNFADSNLRCSNLSQSNLSGSNFYEADLSECEFRSVKLSGANLTAVCLEKTRFIQEIEVENIVCDYIYKQRNQQNRFPLQGNLSKEQCTALFQKSSNDVCCWFPVRIDWLSFTYALSQMQRLHPDVDLEVRAIQYQDRQIAVFLKISNPQYSDSIAEDLVHLYHDTYSITKSQRKILDQHDSEKYFVPPINQLFLMISDILREHPQVFEYFSEDRLPLPLLSKQAVLQVSSGQGDSTAKGKGIKCRICGDRDIKRSRISNVAERLLWLLLLKPYRCNSCYSRFFRWG